MGDCHSDPASGEGYSITPQTKWISPLTTILSVTEFDLGAPNLYAGGQNWPASNTSLGLTVIDAELSNLIALRFYGKQSTDTPENKQCSVRLWGLSNLEVSSESCETLGDWLGDLTITFGSKELDSAKLPVTGARTAWAKEIAVLYDKTLFPGMRQVARGELTIESVPSLVLDAMGYAGFVIQMKPTASEGVSQFGFIYRLF